MNDLEDSPTKIAEDIISQAKMGFNIEAERRILNILTAYRDTKTELDELKQQIVNRNRTDNSDPYAHNVLDFGQQNK